MRTILSHRDQRHLAFLELLMEEKIISLNKASALIGYSVRTLSEDIQQINLYLYPSRIETSKNGVRLIIPTNSSIREVYSNFLKQSREYQLLIYLLYHQGKSQEDIAAELYISLSTFRRIVKTINLELAKKDIHINSAPFRVEGNEIHITELYVALFSELYSDGQGPMTSDEREVLLELSARMACTGVLKIEYPEFIRIYLWMYLRIIRLKNYHSICYTKDIILCAGWEILQDDAFCLRFYRIFNMEISERLLKEIFYPFFSPNRVRTKEDMQRFCKKHPNYYKLDAEIQKLLHSIGESLHISCTDTDKLQINLFNTIRRKDAPPYILYSKSKIFAKEFVCNNEFVATVIMDHIQVILDGTLSQSTKDEVLYLLVTHWPSLLQKVRESPPKVTIGIFFDTDTEHAKMISDLLYEQSKVNIRVLLSELEEQKNNRLINPCIDFLLTNIPGLQSPYYEVICIQEYPTAMDMRNIILAAERAYQKRLAETKNNTR